MLNEIVKNSGCAAFIKAGAVRALERIRTSAPEGIAFLSEEAGECLLKNYEERMELVFGQVLDAEVRKRAEKIDIVGAMLGKFRPESMKKAAQELMEETGGKPEEYLLSKYPLLQGYRQQTDDNFCSCFSDFLNAFLLKRKEISGRLLEGKSVDRILYLSIGGADVHRSGRCVIGVTTDAGKLYYKPHDCGTDVLYHAVVERWFSDCTVAPDVVEGCFSGGPGGRDGKFAFVSCLQHEPVSGPEDISRYYYHFGILAALFHGLGSIDLHFENVISCGDRPAAVDMETILGTALPADREADVGELVKGQRELIDSLTRTGLMPIRLYRMPLISPLYYGSRDRPCLPEYQGQFRTVEGYEDEFARGFREGYGRMLDHRDEIASMIGEHSLDTARCLLRNTEFYSLVRQMLFRPDFLKEESAREKVFDRLCSPYKLYGVETEQEITRYEWQCILKGDIPYFCTTVGGKDLCGEDPGEVVKKDYYRTSIQKSAGCFLSRLSAEEEAFEQDLIRVMFDHAPTDEKPEEESEPVLNTQVSEAPVSEEDLWAETEEMFRKMNRDAVRSTDGRKIWISNAEITEGMEMFGHAAMLGNIGMFAARLAKHAPDTELAHEAGELAGKMCRRIAELPERFEHLKVKKERLHKTLPVGLYTGLGGAILACRKMEKYGCEEAYGLTDSLVRVGLAHQLYRYKKTDAARGAAGLILGLSSVEPTDEVRELAAAAAEMITGEALPDRADLPYGCAGIGAALAAAYEICNDPAFREGALAAFLKVKDEYDPKLSGWPDGKAKQKITAERGPHAAGIYLAAAFAGDKLDEDGGLTGWIRDKALECMLSEKTLYRPDTLDQGNALSVLAFLKAGKKDRAGRILSAMLNRKTKKGCFTVTPEGVRSAFDPSFYMGTPGIGYVMMESI